MTGIEDPHFNKLGMKQKLIDLVRYSKSCNENPTFKSREFSLFITKLQEADMWLAEDLKQYA